MSSPKTRFFADLREGKVPEKSSQPSRLPASLVPPIEEWTEEDHELARLILAAL